MIIQLLLLFSSLKLPDMHVSYQYLINSYQYRNKSILLLCSVLVMGIPRIFSCTVTILHSSSCKQNRTTWQSNKDNLTDE